MSFEQAEGELQIGSLRRFLRLNEQLRDLKLIWSIEEMTIDRAHNANRPTDWWKPKKYISLISFFYN